MVMERRPTAVALLAILRPGDPGDGGPVRRLARLVIRYLAAAFVLLALVYATGVAARPGPDTRVWAHQREAVTVEGGGILNAWSRTAMKVTAWATRGAIERQRDLHRFSVLEAAVGEPAAAGIGAWRERHRPLLQGVTLLAIAGLVGWGVLRAPASRTWLLAALLLVALTVVVTRPATAVRLAGAPADVVGELGVRGFAAMDPANAARPEPLPPADTERTLAEGYWNSFVAHPLSRLQTGTPVLAAAHPEDKPGLLGQLREGIAAVNDWAVGRRGWERAFIATTALVYALPFAVAVGALAMLAACAQAVALVLGIGTLVALPLCVERRWRTHVARYWLAPLGACLVVLAAASLLAMTVMRLADALHGADEYVGLLLAGSALPVAVAAWALARLRRRRGPGRRRPWPRRLLGWWPWPVPLAGGAR